ncbi:hypothetical protein COCNU_04G015050 [Cocos nucifera]|uniref:Uncharacterized protein n=1 Tax=Cocos nucifera TaxID=13894 RepID=A0A8K0N1E5_COCNU|nr:hypothetical protein COCNU_04G015050 [Cocos nucifera]
MRQGIASGIRVIGQKPQVEKERDFAEGERKKSDKRGEGNRDEGEGTDSARLNSILQANENAVEAVSNSQTSKQKVEGTQNDCLVSESRIPQDVPSWVDIFVQEMMNASNWDDVRGRAMKILEAFERNVVAQTTTSVEQEIASLKEQLQCLLRDNQVLKRAVAIQYDRNMEHEKEIKEAQQLEHVISQYQEQIRTLEVVEIVLKTHDHKIDDAIKSLHALCLGDDSTRTDSARLNSILQANENAVEAVSNSQTSKQKVEGTQNDCLVSESRIPQDVPSWVDIFVQEMMNASNWDDVRGRAMKILEAFERNVVAQTTTSVEQEIASLKEQLQCLLRDNQVLKRAVAIQYDRNMEHEKEIKEAQQLEHVISQYQEQIRTLELNNYSLTVHLQRAQESSSIPGRFHPDIFYNPPS